MRTERAGDRLPENPRGTEGDQVDEYGNAGMDGYETYYEEERLVFQWRRFECSSAGSVAFRRAYCNLDSIAVPVFTSYFAGLQCLRTAQSCAGGEGLSRL